MYVADDTGNTAIIEGDEDEEESDDGSDYATALLSYLPPEDCILEGDIPQTFSHYTYRFGQRQHLVCDLQGNSSSIERNGVKVPVFELTEPCIHSKIKCNCEDRGRRCPHRFGATDKGEEGMRSFFKTHQCNAVCEVLRIN